MERTYYTLDDIKNSIELYKAYNGPFSMYTAYSNFTTFMNKCLETAGLTTPPGNTETDESQNCFNKYIWPRFYQEAIIYTDSDETEDFVQKFCRTKAGQIMS